jgi:hypothetical protein
MKLAILSSVNESLVTGLVLYDGTADMFDLVQKKCVQSGSKPLITNNL